MSAAKRRAWGASISGGRQTEEPFWFVYCSSSSRCESRVGGVLWVYESVRGGLPSKRETYFTFQGKFVSTDHPADRVRSARDTYFLLAKRNFARLAKCRTAAEEGWIVIPVRELSEPWHRADSSRSRISVHVYGSTVTDFSCPYLVYFLQICYTILWFDGETFLCGEHKVSATAVMRCEQRQLQRSESCSRILIGVIAISKDTDKPCG